ncbi:FkbM family methyltransferase [Hymenobacter taeanensis]|uniref:FkbM family methyltransferase n=1 Tax=Hymenobacter taeanensis TaxID=2735321 RepID=A0A6M6BFQ7_9BACT|nr:MULTISPECIES: FkbM family methyltransferase [Hymenobacter]QJX47106.1 FkbM family methyltransferase [Hymenobacter taeanensis]UOQ81020.1 FkbM family methyltransferase [Hymenobacter sp. 5414T-23]
MMKQFRKLLVRTLGFESYIRLVSRVYLRLVGMGWGRQKYPELFFLEKLVRPGYVCVDIGANLGYYSVALSRLVGAQGRVLAVEPIPDFQAIWKDNVRLSHCQNLTLLPYALGGENTTVQMGTPERDGLLHHGMTKVAASNTQEHYARTYDVPMRVPDELFSQLERLDFVKCDVEGFEYEVFRHMQATLRRFQPLIQTELNGLGNRQGVVKLLAALGYKPFMLSERSELVPCSEAQLTSAVTADFYFQPISPALPEATR